MVPEIIKNLLAKNGIGIVLSLFCALLLVVAVLFGFKRRGAGAFVRLITLVLAAVAALILAKFLAAGFDSGLVETIKERLANNETMRQYLEDNPALLESLGTLVRMLIAPVLFWICYLVLKLVTYVVFKILCAIFRTKNKPKTFGRLTGAVIGLVCGLVGVVVLVVPLLGFTDMAAEVLAALPAAEEGAEEGSTVTETAKGVDSLNKAPGASVIYKTGGSKLFDVLTTTTIDTKKVVLRTEVKGAIAILGDVQQLRGKPVSEYGEEETAVVKQMVTDFDSSVLMTNIGSGFLAGASQSWLDDRSFMGLAKPQLDENVEVIVNGLLRVFSTSNADNIGDDLGTFVDVFDLLCRHGIFAYMGEDGDTEEMTTKLTTSGALAELYVVLDANPRMKPVKSAFMELGVRILMSRLDVAEDLLQEYEEMMNDVAGALKNAVDEDGTINTETLRTEINTAIAKEGVTVDDSTVELISDAIADEFTAEELETLTVEELAVRLADRFSEIGADYISSVNVSTGE